MSSLLSTFSCCWFWFLVGALLGWLLNWWLCKCNCDNNEKSSSAVEPVSKAEVASVSTAAPEAVVAAPAAVKPAPEPVKEEVVSLDLAAAKAAGFKVKTMGDLTVVEGIGPKIKQLFHDDGINTFADLAKQTVPQMRAMLDKAGSRYRMANPQTWAEQAALAADNKWAELKKMQDALSGGVKK